jgi:putative endopeptidase
VIDRLIDDQRFFLAWRQFWRQKITDDALRKNILSDFHSPGQYRVNGIVRNMEPWYQAFEIKKGDEPHLESDERVTIW